MGVSSLLVFKCCALELRALALPGLLDYSIAGSLNDDIGAALLEVDPGAHRYLAAVGVDLYSGAVDYDG